MGAKLLEAEMNKIGERSVALSLTTDWYGAVKCHDDVSGDELQAKLVQDARKLEV